MQIIRRIKRSIKGENKFRKVANEWLEYKKNSIKNSTYYNYKFITYVKTANIIEAESEKVETDLYDKNFNLKLSGIVSEINTDQGYMKVRINSDYKYYNFKFEEKQESDIFPNRTLFLSKKDGKYGFVDKTGKVIVDYAYDDAMEQNDYGFVAVKKDNKWGSINGKGTVIQEPTYNLDDYLLINFIGRWHFGLDINMNYYNQE